MTGARTLLLGLLAAATFAGPGVASAHTAPRGRDVHLRVMSYNILHGAGEDGVFDRDRTAAAIRAQRPDVVGLQEVDDHWDARSNFVGEPAVLAAALHMHVFFGAIYDLPPSTAGAPDRRYGVAILSRYRIVHAVDHQITRLSTQDPDPTPAPAPGFPEVVVDVHGQHLHVFDTHLDYRADPSVRQLQVADTVRIMRRAGGRQVLVGDFNAEWDAPELAGLHDYGLTDAWTATGRSGGDTYPADEPTERIDHVTVTPGIHVRDAFVPDTQASDHRPVVTDLAMTRTQHTRGGRT
jgi:endonuclease/exonuclease/phosphatase family metal-dependent hydrolase